MIEELLPSDERAKEIYNEVNKQLNIAMTELELTGSPELLSYCAAMSCILQDLYRIAYGPETAAAVFYKMADELATESMK